MSRLQCMRETCPFRSIDEVLHNMWGKFAGLTQFVGNTNHRFELPERGCRSWYPGPGVQTIFFSHSHRSRPFWREPSAKHRAGPTGRPEFEGDADPGFPPWATLDGSLWERRLAMPIAPLAGRLARASSSDAARRADTAWARLRVLRAWRLRAGANWDRGAFRGPERPCRPRLRR